MSSSAGPVDETRLASARTKAAAAIDAAKDELGALSLAIHGKPELNFEEELAHRLLTDYLAAKGFEVEKHAYGMQTAFRAVWGSGEPTVAVLCEYDALPEMGHACGHNLIAAAGVGAGLGLKAALGEGAGTVLVLGTPAEEGGGGKIYMIERHAFDGVCAALMAHPSVADSVWPSVVALQTLEVDFHGRAAHAAAFPWEGLNALDALVLGYNALSMLRQQLTPDIRVHGVIKKGGEKPNIIPDHTAAEFYLRAGNMERLDTLRSRVISCFEGAAHASGCRLDHRFTGRTYAHMTTSVPLAERFRERSRELGLELPAREHDPFVEVKLSTDMGNVSHVVPSIHPMFRIPTEAGNHHPLFTEAAASRGAHEAMLRAAKGLAATALDLYLVPGAIAALGQSRV